jgi:hypothetical protein
MRKFAAILAIVLAAAMLHFGAMAAVQALSQVATSHSADAAGHGAPFMPSCPSGYVCPSLPVIVTGVATLAIVAAFLAVMAVVSAVSAAFRYLRVFRYVFAPPNDPKALLSVFKRE